MGLSSCVCCFPVGLCPTMADLVGAFVWGGGIINRVRSIPWHGDFHAALRNSLFAVEFAACRGKMWNFPFLLHFI